jgi:nitrate/nitrite transporter NarK
MFAYFGFLGCFFSPKSFGSSVLLLTSIQDIFWFFMIVFGGGYTFAETLGVKNAIHRLKEKKREIDAERERRKAHTQQQGQGEQDEKHGYEGGREREGEN